MKNIFLDIMLLPFLECLILIGIHSYLGIHVIRRKVIFVDLSLAQIAALGTTVGFLIGLHPSSTGAFIFSMGFTFLGAGIFALSRFRNEKVPQEAIIGVVYAIAAGLVIILIDKSPHGAEHLKEIMTGKILWVKSSTVLYAAIAYLGVGIFHFIFRKQFSLISDNPEKAYRQGISVRFWDFLFYVSFGFVITFSVDVAGVLLVFIFLVVPAVIATMITQSLFKQLMIGWGLGTVVTTAGLLGSYFLDLPTGPAVIAAYGLTLVLAAIIIYIIRAKNRTKAFAHLLLGIIVFTLIALVFYLGAKILIQTGLSHPPHEEDHHHDHADVHSRQNGSIPMPAGKGQVSKPRSQGIIGECTPMDFRKDPHTYMDWLKKHVENAPCCGYKRLIEAIRNDKTPLFFKSEVLELLQNSSGIDFAFDLKKPAAQNQKALEEMGQWFKKQKFENCPD